MKTAALSRINERDPLYHLARKYAVSFARNPDSNSEFARKTELVRDYDDNRLIRTLLLNGYDMLIGYDKRGIVGHYAFQIHNNSMHVFHGFVKEEYRGRGTAKTLLDSLIDYVRKRGVKEVRIGRVGIRAIKKLAERDKAGIVKVDMEKRLIEIS